MPGPKIRAGPRARNQAGATAQLPMREVLSASLVHSSGRWPGARSHVGLGVEEQHIDPSDSPACGSQDMSSLLQFVTNRFINPDVDLQCAQLGFVLPKRARVVGGGEPRR